MLNNPRFVNLNIDDIMILLCGSSNAQAVDLEVFLTRIRSNGGCMQISLAVLAGTLLTTSSSTPYVYLIL